MLDSEVDSARTFVRVWLSLTVLVLGYAWLDLCLHPRLRLETEYTMQPDVTQLRDLWHWGGRLLNHHEFSLLAGNALVLSGIAALLVSACVKFFAGRRRSGREHPNVVTSAFPTYLRQEQPSLELGRNPALFLSAANCLLMDRKASVPTQSPATQ